MKTPYRISWVVAVFTLVILSTEAIAEGGDVCPSSELDAAISQVATTGSCNPDGSFLGASGLAAQIVSYAQSQKNRGRCISALAKSKAAVLKASKVFVAIGSWTAENQYALYNALKREQLGDVCADLPGRPGDHKPNPEDTPRATPTPEGTPRQSLTAQFNTAVKQSCCSEGQKVSEFGECLTGADGVVAQFVKAHEENPIINQFKRALMVHLNKFINDFQCS